MNNYNNNKIPKATIDDAKNMLRKKAKDRGLDTPALPKPFSVKVKQYIDENGNKYCKGNLLLDMSMDSVRDYTFGDNIKGNGLKILFALASCVDSECFAFPTQSTLAKLAGMSDYNQVAQHNKLLMEGNPLGQTLIIGDKFTNPKNGRDFYMYYFVGCQYVFEEYNYVENDDVLPLDDDIDKYLVNDAVDAPDADKEKTATKAVAVKEEETVLETVEEKPVESLESISSPSTLALESNKEPVTAVKSDKAMTDKKPMTPDKPMTLIEAQEKKAKEKAMTVNDADDVDMSGLLSQAKETQIPTDNYTPPKFKRGIETSAGFEASKQYLKKDATDDTDRILETGLFAN